MRALAIMLGDNPEHAVELLQDRRATLVRHAENEPLMTQFKQGNYVGRIAIVDELINDLRVEYSIRRP